MRLHHVGYATKDIKRSVNFLRKAMSVKSVSEIIHDPLQEADLCMVELEDNSMVEFISGKVVENILSKRVNLYHICYEVDDICVEKDRLIKAGAVVVSEDKTAVLLGGALVCFLLTPIGLIELMQMGQRNEYSGNHS